MDQTFESCACESVARGVTCGVIAPAGVPLTGALTAGASIGRASAAAERSQCRTAPSEPPETRIGWIGCQVTAIDASQHALVYTDNATYSRLPSCDREGLGIPSSSGYRRPGRSGLVKHWQRGSHRETKRELELCFCDNA